jgi:hypothetical protein
VTFWISLLLGIASDSRNCYSKNLHIVVSISIARAYHLFSFMSFLMTTALTDWRPETGCMTGLYRFHCFSAHDTRQHVRQQKRDAHCGSASIATNVTGSRGINSRSCTCESYKLRRSYSHHGDRQNGCVVHGRTTWRLAPSHC